MKLKINIINKTALYKAVENDNTEIVRLLLSCKNIDVNAIFILKLLLFLI